MEALQSQPIHSLLTPAMIRVGLPGTTKEEVLEGLLDLLVGHPAVADLEEVRAAVRTREAMLSTGVGEGIGLPHAKTGGVSGTVAAFAVTKHPIEYGAFDGKPVQLVFLLVGSPSNMTDHLKILSRLSLLLNRPDFRERLLAARTAQAVLEAFIEAEPLSAS